MAAQTEGPPKTRRSAVRVPKFAVRGRRGVVSLYLAAGLTTLLGVVGFGTEAGNWYFARRQGQNVADAAALAGVLALGSTGLTCSTSSGVTAATNAATYEATQNGYASSVTVNCPPASGSQVPSRVVLKLPG